MSNRFDLMLHTTHANLSIAMRHLGGVYTQRYNRLVGRDGPLFRGRFRAVLFEPQTVLLGVSRHLHRRPLVTGMVQRLDRYRWSSYPSFVTSRRKPEWLRREAVLAAVGYQSDDKDGGRVYRQYVERDGESNDLVRQFYRRRRPGAVLGSDPFIRRSLSGQEHTPGARASIPGVPPRRIIRAMADHFEVTRRSILTSSRGRTNLPRMAAMWLCRKHSHLTLEQLARHFRLSGYGSVSGALHRAEQQTNKGFWAAIKAVEEQIQLPEN